MRLKDNELKLRTEYDQFLLTPKGIEWANETKERNQENKCDFGDYLYDFYPELLM